MAVVTFLAVKTPTSNILQLWFVRLSLYLLTYSTRVFEVLKDPSMGCWWSDIAAMPDKGYKMRIRLVG